jgi:type III restriction enzyme
MMLREGWDVRAVSVVLGLRPFTAKAEILPEQVIGRGLRLMTAIGPDRTQTLEVLGTRNLLKVLRDQLEAEGVGVATTSDDPPRPVIIEPLRDRLAYDIAIPITKPRLTHNVRKLSALDPVTLEAIYDQEELDEVFRITLTMEFATTETEVHQADLAAGTLPMAQELLASIAELFPIVRGYVVTRCFR